MASWSDREIQWLEDNYRFGSQKEIENYFDERSWPAIRRKASRIGVSRHPQYALIQSIRRAPSLEAPDKDFNNYIVGFVDGEGSFNYQYLDDRGCNRFRFSIGLDHKDREILERIHSYLGVGSVGTYERRDSSYNPASVFYVSNYGELIKVIVPFFNKYSPRAKLKLNQYREWKEKLYDKANFTTERFIRE